MVAPLGDSSIAITRDCLDLESTFVVVEAVPDGCASLATADDIAEDVFFRLFECICIEIPHSVKRGFAPHHRRPTSAIEPAGQDPRALKGLGTDQSTALFAEECQSFLDNLVAGFRLA